MKLFRGRNRLAVVVCVLSGLSTGPAWGQAQTATTTAATAVSHNSSYIQPDGTAHVARIVPVPQSLSPQARATLRRPVTDADVPEPLEKRRAMTDAYTARAEKQWRKVCPVTGSDEPVAGGAGGA